MSELLDLDEIKKKAKIIHASNEELQMALAEQIEHTRQLYDIPKTVYADLLNISFDTYMKVVNGSRALQIIPLLNFCRIFGYDLSKIAGRNTQDDRDIMLKEFSVLISSFSDETLDGIRDLISNSKENETQIKRANLLIDKIKDDKDGFILFSQDIPNKWIKNSNK